MGIFEDMLKSGESLFVNPVVLDYDYQPKVVPYRDSETRQIAYCIKPLFQQRNGSNLLIFGPPGVGKTVACKHLLQEIGEQTDEIMPVYVNCWQHNTSFKVLLAICDEIGYRFAQNKRTEEIFSEVKRILNKKCAVLVFDEIDKMEDFDFLYSLLSEIYKKAMILITNYREWYANLDERLRSRLVAGVVEFKPYSLSETKGILKQRIDYAFAKETWEEEAVELIAVKTAELSDLRIGLHLLKEAGQTAEDLSLRRITKEHSLKAIGNLSSFSIKSPLELEEETQEILRAIKENSGKRIGEIYKICQDSGSRMAYKTFQRKIKKLELGKFITTSSISGGIEGKTTIIKIADSGEKKLSDF